MDEGSSEPDILEQGGGSPRLPHLLPAGWRPSRGAAFLAAVTLAIGLAAGYAAGRVPARSPAAAAATPSPAAASLVAALTEAPGTCSVQATPDLELGIPVTNQSSQAVQLDSVTPVPLVPGIFKVLSWRWDPCGLDNDGSLPQTVTLGPGETTWVTAVVQLLAACPGPAPLQFRITYSAGRRESTASLPGFPDLSAVHYIGCPAPAA